MFGFGDRVLPVTDATNVPEGSSVAEKPVDDPSATTFGWNQPVCTDCWVRDPENQQPVEDDPESTLIRVPIRVNFSESEDPGDAWGESLEICCKCGRTTTSGIYIRVNPLEVPYPTYGP